MVVAAQVKDAVDRRLDHVLGVLGADEDVAELARARRRAAAVDREAEHVGGLVAVAVLAVELADPLLAHELEREVAVGDPGRVERRTHRLVQLGGDVGEVDVSIARLAALGEYSS